MHWANIPVGYNPPLLYKFTYIYMYILDYKRYILEYRVFQIYLINAIFFVIFKIYIYIFFN